MIFPNADADRFVARLVSLGWTIERNFPAVRCVVMCKGERTINIQQLRGRALLVRDRSLSQLRPWLAVQGLRNKRP